MQINISYDSSVAALDPTLQANFKSAVEAACAFYDRTFVNDVSVNLTFSYGEIDGTPMAARDLGESEAYENDYTYDQLRAAAVGADTSSPIQQAAAKLLPASDPTGGAGTFVVDDAEAKALGLQLIDSGTDGYVGLSGGDSYSWSQSAVASGTYDAVGVLEHEISEDLGRVAFAGGNQAGDGSQAYTLLDFYRYTAANDAADAAPGTAAGAAEEPFANFYDPNADSYFSYNGQTVTLQYDTPANVAAGADVADWASTAGDDSYLGYANPGVAAPVSATDLEEMNVLGYIIADTITETAPAALAGAWNAPAALSGLSVSDSSPIGGNILTMTLSATGLAFDVGTVGAATVSGQGTGDLTITGTAGVIDAALATTTFQGADDFFGTATISATTVDAGGDTSGTDTIVATIPVVALTSYANVATVTALDSDLAAISAVSSSATGAGVDYAITLAADASLVAVNALEPINLRSDDTLTLAGSGAGESLEGVQNGYLIVATGALTITDLSVNADGTGNAAIELEGGTAANPDLLTLGAGQSADDSTYIDGDIDSDGVASVRVEGAGLVALFGTNDYSGGTFIESGALRIGSAACVGSGAIDFAGADVKLILGSGVAGDETFANTLENFAGGDSLDITGLVDGGVVSARAARGELTVSNGSTSEIFTLDDGGNGYAYGISEDSQLGTVVTAIAAPSATAREFVAEPATLDADANGFIIEDSAADIAPLLGAIAADTHVDGVEFTDAVAPTVTLTQAQALDDAVALHEILNSSYTIAVAETAAQLGALATAEIAALAAAGVTELVAQDASIKYTVAQSDAIAAGALAVAAPSGDEVRENFSSGASEISYFGAGSRLTRAVTIEATGAFDDHVYGVAGAFDGVAYASIDKAYSSAGALVARTYDSATGAVVAARDFTANGGFSEYIEGVLARERAVQSDGASDMHVYGVSGTVGAADFASFDIAFTAAGARDAVTFYNSADDVVATETVTSNGGFTLDVGGTLYETKTVDADGDFQLAFGNVAGQTYTAAQSDFSASGAELARSFDDGSTSGIVNLFGDGLQIAANAGALGPSAAPDDFSFTAHGAETFAFQGAAADDVVNLSSGFGAVGIKGFATAASTDVVNVSALFANYAAAQAAMTTSGSEATITDAQGDTLTFFGASASSLTAARLGFG